MMHGQIRTLIDVLKALNEEEPIKDGIRKELQANPALELCGCKLEENEIQTPWIRFSAEAYRIFENKEDGVIKIAIYNE